MSAWGLVIALLAGWKWGISTGFGVVATVLTIFAIVAYISASLGTVVYFRRFRRDDFHMLRHGVVPIAGAAAFAVPLYYLFIPLPSAPLVYANWFSLAIIVGLILVMAFAKTRALPLVGDEHMGLVDMEVIPGTDQ